MAGCTGLMAAARISRRGNDLGHLSQQVSRARGRSATRANGSGVSEIGESAPPAGGSSQSAHRVIEARLPALSIP
jgi:hypothetical protein